MRIIFIDLGLLDYTADTPLNSPLGGTESALCYLALALSRQGHAVSVCNATTTPGVVGGVEFRRRADPATTGFVNRHDVGIVIGAADASSLRALGVTIPLVMWTGHLPSFANVQALQQRDEVSAWAAFAFVSDWQRDGYLKRFGIPFDRTIVLRNAIAPAFERTVESPAWFESGSPPTLVYTSTPFRGLVVLLHAFAGVRAAIPDVRLRIFSGMATYQAADSDTSFASIYALARSMAGIEYVGPVSQPRLAHEIASAAALAYPSVYAETSCIAALEAMRCGATVVTTRLGALPETVGPFGVFVDMPAHARELVDRYASVLTHTLIGMRDRPSEYARRRTEQREYVQEHYTWSKRAAEWTIWLEKKLG